MENRSTRTVEKLRMKPILISLHKKPKMIQFERSVSFKTVEMKQTGTSEYIWIRLDKDIQN